jgi:14-3-3 protein epsilon
MSLYIFRLGDYQRYKAEVLEGSAREAASEKSLCYYASASSACAQYLDPCHPIRLGLALNQSVFFYEIMGKTDKACDLAKDAIGSACEAMQASDMSGIDTRKDATLIMQLLQDNLKLWQDGQYGNDEGEQSLTIPVNIQS